LVVPISWFHDRVKFEAAAAQIERGRRETERCITNMETVAGYCPACRAPTDFHVRRELDWTDLREAIICPTCHLNGRMRLLVTAIDAADAAGRRSHILERFTPFFVFLSGRHPNLTGSEYLGPSYVPGSRHRLKGLEGIAVEHQDFMNLSFADGSIDLLVHGDVLEHVPDHRRCFAEAARVLAPGGQMLFTAPFFARDDHLVRARMEADELRVLVEPPVYHGNPLSPKGSLVFTEFGWPLLDDMRRAGFARAAIGLLYDPHQGIVSNNNPCPEGFMWPVMFRATK
jgi:SAM-dependent methyltransferase